MSIGFVQIPSRERLLSPDVLAVVEAGEAVGGPPAHELPVERQRARHEREAAKLAGPGPEMASVRDLAIDGPHGPLAMREYTPAEAEPSSAIAYFHGGGWVVGSVASFDPVARALAEASGTRVVVGRLPARARAPVPRAGATRPSRRSSGWPTARRASPWQATARAPTSPPSPRAA